MEQRHFVYILASRPRGALYIGTTINLAKRVEQHRLGKVVAHTRRYGIYRLVYWESADDLMVARYREYVLKRWRRRWKIRLIEAVNPEWKDLSSEIPI